MDKLSSLLSRVRGGMSSEIVEGTEGFSTLIALETRELLMNVLNVNAESPLLIEYL